MKTEQDISQDKIELQRQFSLAVVYGDYESVRNFIRSGTIDVNYGDPTADSPLPSMHSGDNIENALVAAARWGSSAMINLLLDEGQANVNARGCEGYTALHAARNFEDAIALIEHGADVNAITLTGKTPLMRASYCDIASTLIRFGANINLRDNEGNTALHHAVKWANEFPVYLDLVELLVEAGADPRITNNDGKTASDLMLVYTKEGRQAIAKRVDELNLRDALQMSVARQNEQASQGSGRKM